MHDTYNVVCWIPYGGVYRTRRCIMLDGLAMVCRVIVHTRKADYCLGVVAVRQQNCGGRSPGIKRQGRFMFHLTRNASKSLRFGKYASALCAGWRWCDVIWIAFLLCAHLQHETCVVAETMRLVIWNVYVSDNRCGCHMDVTICAKMVYCWRSRQVRVHVKSMVSVLTKFDDKWCERRWLEHQMLLASRVGTIYSHVEYLRL